MATGGSMCGRLQINNGMLYCSNWHPSGHARVPAGLLFDRRIPPQGSHDRKCDFAHLSPGMVFSHAEEWEGCNGNRMNRDELSCSMPLDILAPFGCPDAWPRPSGSGVIFRRYLFVADSENRHISGSNHLCGGGSRPRSGLEADVAYAEQSATG